MRGLTGKISNLKDDSKRRAILKLKLAIEPYTPEQKLWFRVIEQAIADCGFHPGSCTSRIWAISSAGTAPTIFSKIRTASK